MGQESTSPMETAPVREQLKSTSSASSSASSSPVRESSMAAISSSTIRSDCSRGSGQPVSISMDVTGIRILPTLVSTNVTGSDSNLNLTSSSSSPVNSDNDTNTRTQTLNSTRNSVVAESGSVPCPTTRSDAAAHPVPPSPPNGSPPRTNNCVIEPTNRMLMTRASNISRLDTSNNCPYNRPSTCFEALKSEQVRLNSFYGPGPLVWPVSFISPADCARAGFYFLRDGDKVQCAFCRGVAGEWEDGDVPLIEHRRHFPRCPFICNLPVGNIPIGQEDAAARLEEVANPSGYGYDVNPASYGYDVCGPYSGREQQLHVRGAQPLNGDADDIAISLGIQTKSGPARKSLVTLQSRLKTFTGWPQNSGQTPDVMAEAGFFFIGTRDHVKCFYCDGGLRNWEEGDDPWFEHARWFAHCPYVLLNKGPDYIKNATETKPPGPPALSTEMPHPRPRGSQSTESSSENSSGDEDGETKEKPVAERCPSKDSDSGFATSSVASGFSDDETTSSSSEDETPGKPEGPQPRKDSKAFELEEEIRQLKEARQCKICMDNEVGVVFLPCGHFVSCVRCATALSNCALCRKPIKAVVRTYLS